MMHKLVKLEMTENINQCWKTTGCHEEKAVESTTCRVACVCEGVALLSGLSIEAGRACYNTMFHGGAAADRPS